MQRKLKAVIDTNLFVSGLFAKDALSAQLQNLWINQEFELITSLPYLIAMFEISAVKYALA